jgi:phage shock protein A
MMRLSEIQQRFDHIEQTIHHASQACAQAVMLPMDLKDSIQQLDEKSGQAKQVMQSQDEGRIRQCIDDLEELGDRAKDACERTGTVDDNVKNAVMQAHRELSELKHQLH